MTGEEGRLIEEQPEAVESTETAEVVVTADAAETAEVVVADADETATTDDLPVPSTQPESPCRPKSYLAGWPFLLYLLIWVGLAVFTYLSLNGPDAATVPLDDPSYPVLLAAAVALVGLGPVLSFVVWLIARAKAPSDCRSGLLTTALVRGAAATLAGVLAWWGALLLVDALRLGLI